MFHFRTTILLIILGPLAALLWMMSIVNRPETTPDSGDQQVWPVTNEEGLYMPYKVREIVCNSEERVSKPLPVSRERPQYVIRLKIRSLCQGSTRWAKIRFKMDYLSVLSDTVCISEEETK